MRASLRQVVSTLLGGKSRSRKSHAQKRHELVVERAKKTLSDEAENFPSLAYVARCLGVSPGHLSRVFHRVTGQTLSSYMHKRKLEAAQRMLMETHVTIKEVAHKSGFRHQDYFSTWFKHHTHTTPTAFRSLNLKNITDSKWISPRGKQRALDESLGMGANRT